MNNVIKHVREYSPRLVVFATIRLLFAVTRNLRFGIWLVDDALRRGESAQAQQLCLVCRDVLEMTPRLKNRRLREFDIQRRLYELGIGDVVDPLFHCTPSKFETHSEGHRVSTRFYSNGLMINGTVVHRDAAQTQRPDSVVISVDGVMVRKMHLSFIDDIARYRYSIKRPVVAAFNQFAELRVGLSANSNQFDSASCIVRLHIPDGNGILGTEISTRGTLNKKGRFNALPAEIEQQHDRFLHLYNSVRAVLENKCGRALLLMFGTLLGQHRDGDFIPWDDDFDVGYLSAETQPEAVKEEAKAIVLSLLAAGYDVVVGKRLRMPFWVRFGDGAPGEHLSLRPIWRQHGVIWSEIKARMNLSADDFSPVEARMRGVKIYKPKNTEAFLAEYYGESWRTPDPSYSNAVRATPSHVNRNLARSAFSMRDVMAMKQEAESWRTHGRTPGQLHCSNIDGLYPLEVYERIYGW